MSDCTHDCSTCGESCGERKEANVFEKKTLRPCLLYTSGGEDLRCPCAQRRGKAFLQHGVGPVSYTHLCPWWWV